WLYDRAEERRHSCRSLVFRQLVALAVVALPPPRESASLLAVWRVAILDAAPARVSPLARHSMVADASAGMAAPALTEPASSIQLHLAFHHAVNLRAMPLSK